MYHHCTFYRLVFFPIIVELISVVYELSTTKEILLGCIKAIFCCAESVQNHEITLPAHYFGIKRFTKYKHFGTKIMGAEGVVL